MSELTDRDRAAFAAVDDALRAYPLAPAPPNLLPAVMARVRVQSPVPRFRLAWIDYAVSLFAAIMAGLAILLWQSIPPQVIVQAQVELALLLQLYGTPVWVVTLAAGLMLAGCALVLMAWLFAQGQGVRRRHASPTQGRV
ncbi:MAG TPA: hypothetical protein VIK33_09355 [Anaerolineae bacterium]